MTTDERIHKSITKLLLEQPFWGALALKLNIRREDAVDTMGTDGTRLYYNQKFVDNLTDPELMGTLAHELQHLVLGHPWREGNRHHIRWNIACDESFNWLLKKFGFTLPKDTLDDPKYHGMSAEEIYAKLLNDPNYAGLEALEKMMSGQTTFDKGAGSGSKKGDMTAVDWQIAAQQAAAMAKAAGNLPGDLERLLDALTQPKVDWVSVLRRFVDENIQPSNYSWTRPNRRYMAEGTYLPGIIKENTPRIGIGVDTSGSISNKLLQQFAAELEGIMADVMPECLDVVYCDTAVRGNDIFEYGSGPVKFTPYPGGGGTVFQPVFDHFKDKPPACLIYFTDMDSSDTPEEPPYPTLFVAPAGSRRNAPFGEKVEVDFEY